MSGHAFSWVARFGWTVVSQPPELHAVGVRTAVIEVAETIRASPRT